LTTDNKQPFDYMDSWPEAGSGRTAETFTDKTIHSISKLFREIIFSSEYATRPGLMQRLDPRVKLATILALIVAVSFCRRAEFLAGFYAVTLALAAVSKIPSGFFIKRVWLFIPLFSGIIVLPALVMVPGEPLAHLFRIGALDIAITHQGAEAALIFVLRVAASVSFIVLLTLTTKWTSLLRALTSVRVPAIFVLILGISYRYIFFMLSFIEEMYMARRSRTLQPADRRTGGGWVAGRMGYTLSRSLRMGDNVYEAMVSRGFTGNIRLMEASHPGAADIAWAACTICGILAVYFAGGFK
jgi:cobalt/nickel transport system permease protein